MIELAEGNIDEAGLAADQARTVNEDLRDMRRVARARYLQGICAIRQSQIELGRTELIFALEALKQVGDMLTGLLCCLTLAELDGLSATEALSQSGTVGIGGDWQESIMAMQSSDFEVDQIVSFWTRFYGPQIAGIAVVS
jgi:hypothetical protein